VRAVLCVLPTIVALATTAAAQGQAPQAAPAAGALPVFSRERPPAPNVSTNPFLGGVPTGTATNEPLALSIIDAITRGLEHNLGVLTAEAGISHARGSRWRALSDLLPNLHGRIAETEQQVNLRAFGFPLPPGFPPIVGPFGVFDARVYLSQAVFDAASINSVRSETHNVSAARFSYRSARDLVVLVTAGMYLQAIAASARAESARAQLQTAHVLLAQAQDMKQNGLVAGIDVLRAEVEFSTQQQRATVTANDFEKAKLDLARVIGLPVGQPMALTDEVPYAPFPEMTFEQALDRAYKSRPDYQAAIERLHAAEAFRASVVGEARPSVHVNADYGDLGLSVGDSHGTFSVVGALNVPIFQGGRTHGRLLEADADLRNRRAESEDLKAGIYYEVRAAFLDLQASAEQFDVAMRARNLAAAQLTQARDRFAAGVANNIDVTQAQEAVALANEQYISGLYVHNLSKAVLARALGEAEAAVRQYLGGSR
jgi:outer membrane protein TolC